MPVLSRLSQSPGTPRFSQGNSRPSDAICTSPRRGPGAPNGSASIASPPSHPGAPPLHLLDKPVRVQCPVSNQSPELEAPEWVRHCRRDRGPVLEEEQTARDGQERPRPPLSCSSNPRRNSQCPVSRSPLATDAFRGARTIAPSANAHSKSGSYDNASETLEDAVPLPEPRRKIAPRTSRPHPPQNALDKKAAVSRGDPAVALPSAETVLSSFMVKPALFASCALDGAC